MTEQDIEAVMTIFKSFGRVEIISEKLMNVVPSIASSAPAYTMLLIEAMADGGVLHGFPPGDQALPSGRPVGIWRGEAGAGNRRASGSFKGPDLHTRRHDHRGSAGIGGFRLPESSDLSG